MATVLVRPARKSVFVGSHTRMDLEIDPGSGLTPDDLDVVLDPPDAGVVSFARGADWTPATPYVTLLAGHRLGSVRVVVTDKANGTEVGDAKVKTTDKWSRKRRRGPGFWFSGQQDISHPQGGAAWGGGPGVPQNTRATPVSGTWRIGVVFVDTSSQRFPAGTTARNTLRDLWLDHLVNGVLDNGATRSVRLFMEEVSYNNLTLSATHLGFFSLSGAWTSYFNPDGTFMGNFPDAVIAAIDSSVSMSSFDSFMVVSPRVPATTADPERAAWPYSSIGAWGPYSTGEGSLNLRWMSCVADWGQQPGNNREIYETISHELGHNLGLGDQYTPAVPGRNPGSWDLMDWDDPHPHLSIAQRMMLGWVRPEWLTTLDFQSTPAPLDQTFRLHPLEQGAPPAGQRTGLEVRIADGLNYYFEYRRGQAGQIGDRALPTDNRVLGTDVMGDPGTAPISRPQVLLLPDHANDDGAILGDGNAYRDTDYTTPGFPQEFRADVSGITGSKADVRIRYGNNGRPDPSIRPWPAAPNRPWQSPDIEVSNARSSVRPEWANTPWAGHNNTVVAKVKNSGTVAAPDVVVNFYVKNYGLSNAPEVFIGTDTRTIAPGATVDFTASWVAPASGHHCVIARIPLYVVPTAPTIVEMTELNNLAQSNYDRFIPATASPSTREETEVEVYNPYNRRTVVYLNGGQTNPLYRVTVEHRWLVLDAHQSARVKVGYEYALVPGHDRMPADLRNIKPAQVEKLGRVPNRTGLTAWVVDPEVAPRHVLTLMGGAMAEVQVGRKVVFRDFEGGDHWVRGLLSLTTGEPVTGGEVIVTLDEGGEGDAAKYRYAVAKVDSDGRFVTEFKPEWRVMWGDYLPSPGFSTATSDKLSR